LPTDDIFDQAWNVAKGWRLPSSDDWNQMDERRKRGGPLPKTGKAKPKPQLSERILIDEQYTMEDALADEAAGYGKIYRLPNGDYEFVGHHPNPEAEDVEKGFFDDFARKVKQKQKEQEALNEYIVNNLIRNPDGLEAGVAAHHRALEAMNRPPPPAMPESVDSITATPPPRERDSVEPSEIRPETVRAEIPRTGFRGGAEGAPTPPTPNSVDEDEDEDETILQASEPHQVADSWTVVKDPFANPFFNENFASLTEEQPPEVTHDDTPTFSLQPDLIKGDSPEDALKNAGFDARQGDDMSLLPSSAFNKGDVAPRADTSLLPAGWDTE